MKTWEEQSVSFVVHVKRPRSLGSRKNNTPVRNLRSVSTEMDTQTSPGHFEFLMPQSKQAKKQITRLGGVIDPDYSRETELLFHTGAKKEDVWNSRDPLG